MRLTTSIRRFLSAPIAAALVLSWAPAQAAEVGEGAPNASIAQEFVQAYYRGGFSLLVDNPTGLVRVWGGTGLIQEFAVNGDTAGLSVRYALVRATRTAPPTADVPAVFQVHGELFSYYSDLGAATVGFPLMDTQGCPAYETESVCSFQLFSKGYALFSYKKALITGQHFQVRAAFYTKWNLLGGISGMGVPTDNESSVTSVVGGVTATMQPFKSGVLYSITSGTYNGRLFGVSGPVFAVYSGANTHSGHLGMPIGDEYAVAPNRRRQEFQGGAIEYTPGSAGEIRLPVSSVSLGRYDALGAIRLNLGESADVAATLFSTAGTPLTDRTVTWSTSNARVATVQGTAMAVVRAVGGGSAVITASCEGKTKSFTVFVFAPCCQVGEGAPSAAVQQTFQDALTRARIVAAVPTPFPVRRVGAGYVQEVLTAAGARHLIAKSDRSPAAYVVSGELLAAYQRAGGPAGPLGHPSADATSGGTQVFEGGALAGAPPRTVAGAVLNKWGLLGYETGPAGAPVSDAAAFVSVNSTGGLAQAFARGVVYAHTTGARRGQAYFVAAAILARYAELDGPTGPLGAPQSDEFSAGGLARQNFENGLIQYAPGEAAREALNERRPAVTALPASVVAGSRVRFVASGFSPGGTLRVSVTGRPEFVVAGRSGSYSWEAYVPLNAPAATVTVRAVDDAGGSAETAYTVRPLAQARLQLSKLQGDNQIAPPGTRLPAALRVMVRDEQGNAVAGIPVAFRASPGSEILPSEVLADENGEAEAVLRLASAPGVALATAEAGGAVVTFSSQAAGASIVNFPLQLQAGDALLGKSKYTIAQKGALLAAASAVVRYYQNRGEMLALNGLAEPALLNEYLKAYCAFDAQGARICDGFLSNPDWTEPVVNLWRLADFVTGGLEVSVEQAEARAVAELVAQGHPVLLALALTADGVPWGGHVVTAIGVAPDGGLVIHDPNAALGRTRLSEYLNGFSAGGAAWAGKLHAAVRLLPRIAAGNRFLLSAVSLPADAARGAAFDARSAAGPCGLVAEIQDLAVIGEPLYAPPRVSRFLACDGTQPLYQVGLSGPAAATLTDFGNGGAARGLPPGVYKAARPAVTLEITPLAPAFGAVLNSATRTAGLAPGSAALIDGAGLAGPGGEVAVTVGGAAARVMSANAFQVQFEIPHTVPPGTHSVRLASAYGAFEQSVEIREAAPAIFVSAAGEGMIFNQNGTRNSPRNAAARGQALIVYATGLGAVAERGSYSETVNPVVAILNGVEIPVSFAGIAPNLMGTYQVNVVLPTSIPPGIEVPLLLRQADIESNLVRVSLE